MTKDKVIKNLRSIGVIIARHTQGDLQHQLLETIKAALECVEKTNSKDIFKEEE